MVGRGKRATAPVAPLRLRSLFERHGIVPTQYRAPVLSLHGVDQQRIRRLQVATISGWRQIGVRYRLAASLNEESWGYWLSSLRLWGGLGLVSISMRAMRVLELARLDMVFPIHEDLASAIEAGA
jgi:hypothetical protein